MSDAIPAQPPPIKKQRLTSFSTVPSSSPPKPRQFHRIPIFIVDYHNDVMDFIFRCLATRHLPLTGNTLIHFDSHPDMVISHRIKPETVFEKNQLLDEMSIENWIMPGCYSGHFRKIVWIKNSWCDQIPEGDHDFHIGDHDGEIRVDLPVDYYISEGNYCTTKLLNNSKEIGLQVVTCNGKDSDSNPITVDAGYAILDIDLDYFSVLNPFLELYKKSDLYRRLQKIYSYTESGNRQDDTDSRRKQLKHLEEVFYYLDINRCLDEFENTAIPPDHFELVVDLVNSVIDNYPDDEIDWILINDAGNTSDHNGLPHHKSTDEELENIYLNFEKFLKNINVTPTVITMARSAEDDYCPKDQVDGIQARVLKILQGIYGDKITTKPILAYEKEEWDVMQL